MKGNRAALVAIVVVVLAAAGWRLFKRGSQGESIDLIANFAAAQKKPASGTFDVIDAELNGEKKRAIFTVPSSRIIFRVRVPDDGWLKVSVGMKPESWDNEGDGVLFHVGVSDGRAFDPLFSHHLDPFANPSDRQWVPSYVDLSAYAGEEVDLVFNTNTSLPGKGDDPRNDTALWGAPEVVIR